jgi:2-polyprenyl-6-methoxyphenol hydroxylase-like FAD-dependent oxidoreductase
MRIGVVGGGIAGPVAALLLTHDGHDVTVLERVADPRPVGAGFLLQPFGQDILDELGVLESVAPRSMPVRRIDGRTIGGRVVLDFGYPDRFGLGVHRAVLFEALWSRLRAHGIPVETAFPVEALRFEPDGVVAIGSADTRGPFDLLIVADGARSHLRRKLGLVSKDVGYPYAALWSIVRDPDGLAGDVLTQTYDGTRVTLGFLPTGEQQASVFWAMPTGSLDAMLAAGPAGLVERARPYAGRLRPLLERVAQTGILAARYRDVVVPNPTVVSSGYGIVVIGDAAHAMSPQLGLGANLCLADAWSLASVLRDEPDLRAALPAYAADRRAHIRWYTLLSRFMTPVFQSDLVPLGWARDAFFGPVGRIPWVRRQFVGILLGCQTSPWTSWRPAHLTPPDGSRGS